LPMRYVEVNPGSVTGMPGKSGLNNQKTLTESEQRFKALFNNMLNGFAYCKLIIEDDIAVDFIYLEVNKAFESLTGLRNVEGRRVSEIIPGIRETDDELFEVYTRVALTGVPEVFETFVGALDMWFQISVYSPETEFFIAIFDVITKRKETERRLIENEARFRSVLDNMLEGCQIIGFDWRYIYLNDAADIHNRRKKEELLGKKYMDMWPGIEKTGVFCSIKICLEERKSAHMVNNFVFPDGGQGWFDLSIQPVPEGVFILSVDITDQKNAEEALRESEEKFKNVFEFAGVGKSLTSINGNIFVNRIFRSMLGYTRKDLLNIKWDRLTHPDDIEHDRKILETLIHGKKKSYRWEKRYLHKTGRIVWVDVSTVLQRNKEGRPLYFITTVIDITEKKIAEERITQLNNELEHKVAARTAQLETANKELEAFAYSVSHDLRAPLRAVDGFSTFLLEDYGDKLDSEGRRMLATIRQNTQKMDQLINDLLNLSRVTRKDITYSSLDMNQLVLMAIEEAGPKPVIENVVFTLHPLPPVYSDPVFLKQVWINLISNAIKFTSKNEKPEIEIGCLPENSSNIYYIKDNGVGFNMEYSNKLFGVFQRLHRWEDFEGTGVGLAIVQRIIHRFGGKVWAESEIDKGAIFYFSLPSDKD
jgi:PAS domain S-box-containing protein